MARKTIIVGPQPDHAGRAVDGHPGGLRQRPRSRQARPRRPAHQRRRRRFVPGVLIVVMAVMLDRTTTAASERSEKVARGGGGNVRHAAHPPRCRRGVGDPRRGLPLAHLPQPGRVPGLHDRRQGRRRRQRRHGLGHRHLRRASPARSRTPSPTGSSTRCSRCWPSRRGTSPDIGDRRAGLVFGGVRALVSDPRLPDRHLVLRPVARRDDHPHHDAGRHRAGDGPGPGLRRLDGPRPPRRPRHQAAARRRADDPAVRLPDPGARPLRSVPLHRDRRGHRLRRARPRSSWSPTGSRRSRRRPSRRAARPARRRGRRSPRSSCRWPRARSSSPPTRACSTCCP